MRTYTIRDVVRDGDAVRLVVDFVVHEDHGHGQGPGLPLGARRPARRRDPGDRPAPVSASTAAPSSTRTVGVTCS